MFMSEFLGSAETPVPKRGGTDSAVHPCYGLGQLGAVGEVGFPEAFEVGTHRGGSFAVEAYGVHSHVEKVAHLLRVGAFDFCVGVVLEVQDKFLKLCLGVFAEHVEGAEAAVFGGDGVGLHPAAAGVLVEVVLRAHALVEVLGLDAVRRGRHHGHRKGCRRSDEGFP